jgi:hypothetical protein
MHHGVLCGFGVPQGRRPLAFHNCETSCFRYYLPVAKSDATATIEHSPVFRKRIRVTLNERCANPGRC